jgi:hypothetical protein
MLAVGLWTSAGWAQSLTGRDVLELGWSNCSTATARQETRHDRAL